jgi:uracil-DNA glycosylase
MAKSSSHPYLAALQWHIDAGADEGVWDSPTDRTVKGISSSPVNMVENAASALSAPPKIKASSIHPAPSVQVPDIALEGTAFAKAKALELAASAKTLNDLRAVMETFDGLAIRKTATQMVFADGNPKARIMVVGEAPGADEDRQGNPFVGVSGQLLDRILVAIGLNRIDEDPARAVYISNILNWRPPGNRTPSPQEIDISLPFIERHIALIQPKVLILCGGVAAKGLLGAGDAISKLRGKFHTYTPTHPSLFDGDYTCPAIATYHPAYLLRTPLQKKAVWADMLMLKAYLEETFD